MIASNERVIMATRIIIFNKFILFSKLFRRKSFASNKADILAQCSPTRVFNGSLPGFPACDFVVDVENESVAISPVRHGGQLKTKLTAAIAQHKRAMCIPDTGHYW